MKLAFYPRDSLIHLLDPRSKLIFVFTCFIAVLFINSVVSYIVLSLFIIAPFFLSKLPLVKVIKGFIPFLPLFILTFILHLFLTPGEILFKLGVLNATLEGFYKGLSYSVRIFLLVLSAMLFGFTTSPFDLADSLSNFFFRFKSETLREIPMIVIFVFRELFKIITIIINQAQSFFSFFPVRKNNFCRGNTSLPGKHLNNIIWDLMG